MTVSNISHVPVCKYDYNGQGTAYQVLAGPAFIVVFTFTGILVSMFADVFKSKRVVILTVSLVFWSLMTSLSGLAQSYWQLAILRFGLGLGQGGCNPLATSLIAEYFSIELRGAALGIYNWGIYFGYSFSFAVGTAILQSLVRHILYLSVYMLTSLVI